VHVVAVDHRRIGRLAVRLPGRAAVERRERVAARGHVGEAAQPDEAVGVVEVAERGEHPCADRFLGLDEFALEQGDQVVAAARMQRVLAQLEHRDGVVGDSGRHASAPAGWSMRSSSPPIDDKACHVFEAHCDPCVPAASCRS
jgi:hypothetical protein